MTNVLTTWRENIAALVTSTFAAESPRAIVGERVAQSVSRDSDLFCVFASPIRPTAGNVNNANLVLTVRYWKKYPKVGATLRDVPRDPEPIEQLMLDMAAMFKPHLTDQGIDYYHVESITPDVADEYGVEAVLTAWTRNPAEHGG